MDLLLQRIKELTPEQHQVFTYRAGMDVLQHISDKRLGSYAAKDFECTAGLLIGLVTAGEVR